MATSPDILQGFTAAAVGRPLVIIEVSLFYKMELTAKEETHIKKIGALIAQVARAKGLSNAAYSLVRSGNHIVFKNPADKLVARVAPQYLSQGELDRALNLCCQLAANGAPILQPAYEQALGLADGTWVTFWPLGQPVEDLSETDYSRLIIACQAIKPAADLPIWQPRFSLDYRHHQLDIGSQAGLPDKIRKKIESILAKAIKAVDDAWQESRSSNLFCHGDVYPGNIIRFPQGLFLCDPDNICLGPAEVDLSCALIYYRNYKSNMGQWQSFLKNYDRDYDLDLCQSLAELRLAGAICGNASFWNRQPQRQTELIRCLDNFEDPFIPLTDF